MIPTPPPVRIALPPLPAPPGRVAFPVIATLAPVVVSLGLWAITQSVYSLLFAALGPIVAVGGLVDGRFSRRSAVRRDRARFEAALTATLRRIDEAHAAERERLRRLGAFPVAEPRGAAPVGPWAAGHSSTDPLPIHLATATLLGRVELTGDDPPDAPADLLARVAAARARSGRTEAAPFIVDARDGVGVVGPPIVVAAVARSAVAQLATLLPPDVLAIRAPKTEPWVLDLPHDARLTDASEYRLDLTGGREVLIASAEDAARLPLGCGVALRWQGGDVHLLRGADGAPSSDLRPVALSRQRARELAAQLARAADAHGIRPRSAQLPARVDLADLLDERAASDVASGPSPTPGGLAAPIGVDALGTVVLDLVADGPHAVIAGTTGSGKSELLISWVLAIAASHSPDEVTFLLVDFKGGAAFAPLSGLPHVLGTLSDLDARLTRRAILSLRAEVLHRERTLAEHRARGIDELPAGVLPRLVIVVDEFAAVVHDSPELHDVFADLAARGRSLGLHLVLCTQRPSGVVRDAVLANVPIRLSLRVTDRADSVAMVGSDAAAQLPGDARGRAVLSDARGVRDVQVALAAPGDADRVRMSARGVAPRRPWCDPLPSHIELGSLPPAHSGLAFGRADHPDEQRQPVAAHDPIAHGPLLVVGAPASGRSTALAALRASALAAGFDVVRVPAEPADAWAMITGELTRPSGPARPRLLLVDDLDLLVSRVDADYRHELLDHLASLAREATARRLAIAASAQRIGGPLASIAALFGSRIVLRQPNRDEHVLAGADGSSYDPALPPGAGWWRGSSVQVAVPPDDRGEGGPDPDLGDVATPTPLRVDLSAHAALAVVAARPRALAAALRAAGARVHEVGGPAGGASGGPAGGDLGALQIAVPGVPTVLLGDPDAWHADWAALSWARRDLPMVMLGCSPADHRTLLRDRELPPLLGPGEGECWYADEGVTRRAVFVWPTPHPAMESASESAIRR